MHVLGFDHIHPSEEEKEQLSGIIWSADNVELTTVGVDIGSSTSHLMFAKVHLQRLSEALSSRFVVVGREVLWRSRILLTPYRPDDMIDVENLAVFIDAAYRDAGLTKDDVDSGAVILTGEALKRKNSRAIADLFAADSGKFVCATAGHNLEALMAAHGSGAVALSRKEHKTFLNVDIGGGTTKLSLIHGGKQLHSAAVSVGGRLIAFSEDGELVRIERPALEMAKSAGLALRLGDRISPEDRGALVATMVDVLTRAIRQEPAEALAKELALTPALPVAPKPDALTFSGGVAEYIYGREKEKHGDLGGDLAVAISDVLAKGRIKLPVYDPGQGIRATVIGASQFSVQVSGNTVMASGGSLPVRNVPVIRINLDLSGEFTKDDVADDIARALDRFDITDASSDIALALTWGGEPSHARLYALAEGIGDGLRPWIVAERPLILVMDGDIGMNLGQLLRHEINVPGDIISLDGVQLSEFDYVDIGELIEPTHVVPLIIKSLLFSGPDTGGLMK